MSLQNTPNSPAANTAPPLVPSFPKKRVNERFIRYGRRQDERGNALCLAQELIRLKGKYAVKNFDRILERAARAIRAEGRRTTEAKQLEVMLAIKQGAHEIEEICLYSKLSRSEVKQILDDLIEAGKVICLKQTRAANGKGAKRKLYYLTVQLKNSKKPLRHLEK